MIYIFILIVTFSMLTLINLGLFFRRKEIKKDLVISEYEKQALQESYFKLIIRRVAQIETELKDGNEYEKNVSVEAGRFLRECLIPHLAEEEYHWHWMGEGHKAIMVYEPCIRVWFHMIGLLNGQDMEKILHSIVGRGNYYVDKKEIF